MWRTVLCAGSTVKTISLALAAAGACGGRWAALAESSTAKPSRAAQVMRFFRKARQVMSVPSRQRRGANQAALLSRQDASEKSRQREPLGAWPIREIFLEPRTNALLGCAKPKQHKQNFLRRESHRLARLLPSRLPHCGTTAQRDNDPDLHTGVRQAFDRLAHTIGAPGN